MSQPPDGEHVPEANAGDTASHGRGVSIIPVTPPTDEPTPQNGGDDDGELDPGPQPGQPA